MWGSSLRLYAAVILLLSAVGSGTALRCYGSNAFVKAKLGDKDCYDSGLGAYWNPCWARCGSVTVFSHDNSQARYLIPNEDPTNQTLCPYRASGVNGVDGDYSGASSSCNCTAWKEPLPGGKCPSCNDFNVIPPLMMAMSRDASYGGVQLGDCPDESDMCFNFCYTGNSWFPAVSTLCAYGCAKTENKPALELMVSVLGMP
jgi:hypothetical protein